MKQNESTASQGKEERETHNLQTPQPRSSGQETDLTDTELEEVQGGAATLPVDPEPATNTQNKSWLPSNF